MEIIAITKIDILQPFLNFSPRNDKVSAVLNYLKISAEQFVLFWHGWKLMSEEDVKFIKMTNASVINRCINLCQEKIFHLRNKLNKILMLNSIPIENKPLMLNFHLGWSFFFFF